MGRRDQLGIRPRGRGRGRGRGGRGRGKPRDEPQDMDDAEIWEEYETWRASLSCESSTADTCHDPPSTKSRSKSAKKDRAKNKSNQKAVPETKPKDNRSKKDKKVSKATKEVRKRITKKSKDPLWVPPSPKANAKKADAKKGKPASKAKTLDLTEPELLFQKKCWERTLKFVATIDYENLEWDDLKNALEEAKPAPDKTKIMTYWNRPACTVQKTCGRGWTDVGYFSLKRLPDVTMEMQLTVTVGIAMRLVTCHNQIRVVVKPT